MPEPNTPMPTPPPAFSADMAGAPGSPTPVVAPTTTPQSDSNSNAPDADTKAGASIPAPLVNNPQFPSQKAASTVDANKTSPAPQHTMLYKAAQELTGGPRYQTTYDADGNAVRKEIPVSPVHLGLALALEVLSGGMAGAKAPANQPGQAFEAGQEVAEKQRAAVQKANQDQEAQAKSDFQFKRSIAEANMRNYQTAVNVGNSNRDASQKFADSFKPISEGIQDGTIALPEGVTKDEAFETDAMAAVKNGKTNITHDMMIPVGDPLPVMDQNGQQKTVNGIPVWGHNYVTIHGADKFQTTLTKDMQDKLHEIGMFQQDGKNADIGEPQRSFADIANKMSIYASIKAGEQLLTDHKNDAHDILGRKPEDLDNLATVIRTNPAMKKAVGLFAQAQMGTAGGNSHIEDILNTMAQHDPQSASTLMRYLKLTPTDLDAMHNKRVQEETEAKAKPTAAEKIDSDAKANAVLADPKESADRKAQASAFLKGSTSTAANKAGAEATAKANAESRSGDVTEAARNILSGDLTNLKDITSMRGGQRTAMFNAIHDEAVRQGKNPNDWSPAALKTKADIYEDYREGKTSNNIAAFDAFLGHANDAMDANDAWRRSGSPLINKPLSWLSKNAENDTNYTAFTTALEPVRKEFMSFLNANRAEHEGDLKTMGTVLSDTSSPAQIETALKQLGKSADIRLAAIGRKYENTMGTAFPNLVSDEGKQTLQRMGITSKTSAAGNQVKPGFVSVQIPGQPAGSIPTDKVAAFRAKYPNAVIGQ